MCGRYALQCTAEKLRQRYDLPYEAFEGLNFSPSEEIFPSGQAPVILPENQEHTQKRLALYHWGFSPSFASSLIINARGESVENKPTFRDSFYKRRCLVPVTSFYEWQDTNKGKIKYKISLKKEDLFSLAAIYKVYQTDDGKSRPSYCIITTSAVRKIKPIHPRMPVILSPAEEKIWLNPTEKNTTHLKKCLTGSGKKELILQAQ